MTQSDQIYQLNPLRLKQEPISFQDLMRKRVHEILVVASLYDSFKLEEDGRLTELIFAEYQDMHFVNAPHVNRVASASQALDKIKSGGLDLIITMPRISDMNPFEFGRQVHEIDPDLPVILLVSSSRESRHYTELERQRKGAIDKIFYWSGNSSVLPAIIKYSEDKRNAERDILKGLVRAIIVVEDSPQFYSSFLPMIYKIITRHTVRMMKQEYDDSLKLLRVRARPRILLASTYEEALSFFNRYRMFILAVISDLRFPCEDKIDRHAGIRLLRKIQETESSIPLVLQSMDSESRCFAEDLNIRFFDKSSSHLLDDLRDFIFRHCGFKDLAFTTANGDSITVKNLKSLEEVVENVPDESMIYHAQRNHFSNWLAMRGYFEIANRIKAYTDLENIGNLRSLLKNQIKHHRRMMHKQAIVDYFNPEIYDPEISLVRIGDGSLGGKARGIIFVSIFLRRFALGERFPEVDIKVPDTAMIGTDIFDDFLERNNIRSRLDSITPDSQVNHIFVQGTFDPDFETKIKHYLSFHQNPVAVRSSSLLEDSVFQPFAGIYSTFMIPCCQTDIQERTQRTLQAIKLVYASCFLRKAQAYLKSTGNRPEDEKMAVLIQDIVGEQHGDYYYPTFAGTLQTYNFYPLDKIRRRDGIANVALGLGRTVVSGGKSLRFSPRHPSAILQYYDRKSIYRNSQSHFYAVRLNDEETNLTGNEEDNLALLPLQEAEDHGVLDMVASVYSPESDMFRESLYESGPRIITFANILKWKTFPLDQILIDMMNFGRRGLGCEVEMEFASNLSLNNSKKPTFSILQIRPLITHNEISLIDKHEVAETDLVCRSEACLGNGIKNHIRHIIYVKLDTFNSGDTRAIAGEIAELNQNFDSDEPYLLMGPGRWGSADPLLGIPVEWNEISNVGAIVEIGLPSFYVEPSFGSHFFQNLTSLSIDYFFTSPANHRKKVDFSWLDSIDPAQETAFLKHLKFEDPMIIQVDGRKGHGFVIKPGRCDRYLNGD